MGILINPTPFEYESLASYIKRVSQVNVCPEEWVNEILLLPSNVGADNLNNCFDNDIIRHMADALILDTNTIRNMTIHRFSDRLWSQMNFYHKNRFIEGDQAKFCPICLKENH